MAKTVRIGTSELDYLKAELKYAKSDSTGLRQSVKELTETLIETLAQHAETLERIIDAFGIRGTYADIETSTVVHHPAYIDHSFYGYSTPAYDETVTTVDKGADRLMADVKAAADAARGSEAAARIAAALKGKK